MGRPILLSFVALLWHLLFLTSNPRLTLTQAAELGQWTLLQKSIGIVSMHMQLLQNDRVVIFDRTDFGKSSLLLPNGRCRNNSQELSIKYDCTAHSAEFDVKTNSFRPLFVQTNVWCSSGSVAPDGRLIQTGGFNDGDRHVRIFKPCSICDWQEIPAGLAARRWYATNQILPDGRVIIIGGRAQFNYEFYPKSSPTDKVISLPFLAQTNVAGAENNLYPFVHLNVDGNLFIFANNRAILFNYVRNVVVRTYPEIPGGDPRCYPSTGSSVLLPVRSVTEAEVLICGGAPKGAFQAVNGGTFPTALRTCGRIKITDAAPAWVIETMPTPRVMGDMILLPNGNVLIINGASSGTAGWEVGRNPVLSPALYRTNNVVGKRFQALTPSTIPRMYHSAAILLRDGRVLVGGSNPHVGYSFKGVLFPTELSLEAFSPPYLDTASLKYRPTIITPTSQVKIRYGQRLTIRFSLTADTLNTVSVTIVAPSFTTHSYSMNQRLVVIGRGAATKVSGLVYEIQVAAPSSGIIAPSGYYMLYVVNSDIPSAGIWIHIS